ncbi:MAG: calcium-binding protein [Alphaproteobacteria bacterium]
MGVVIGTQALGHVENGILAAFHGFELIPRGSQQFDMVLENGNTLTAFGRNFVYKADGTVGGTITDFEETNEHGVIFHTSEFNLSASALFGFIADQRPLDLASYMFAGDDRFVGTEDPNDGDVAAGFGGNDTISTGGGADSIDGADGEDLLDGGDHNDVVLGERGSDEIYGGNDNDTLLGGAGLDTISGGEGNDIIFGGRDYDVLSGDAGDDIVYGDRGGDDIHDGAGNDTIFLGGGTGDIDWVYFSSGSGQDRVLQFDIEDGDQFRIESRINNTNIVDFASLVGRITDDGHGDAIVDLGGGNYIRIVGVDRADIDASWFAFEAAPTTSLLGGAAA